MFTRLPKSFLNRGENSLHRFSPTENLPHSIGVRMCRKVGQEGTPLPYGRILSLLFGIFGYFGFATL